MDEKEEFCPQCDRLLNPVELTPEEAGDTETPGDRKGLYRRCAECNFARPTASFSTTHFTKRLQKGKQTTLNMDPGRVADLVYDKTYPVTQGISCVNKNCPSKKGKGNPPIVLLTSDKHPELGYLCSVCKHMWGRF